MAKTSSVKKMAAKTTARKKTKRKTKADRQREQLLQQRQEILDMYEQDLRAGKVSSDEGAEDIVDKANSAYNREFLLLLSGNERDTLREIEAAIERLDAGTYGQCGNCGQDIPAQRIEALPWALYCVDCQERAEKGLLEDV